MWSQKSRIKWLKEGDMNTKFFHLMVNWRRKKNEIKGLFIEDIWYEQPMVVKNYEK